MTEQEKGNCHLYLRAGLPVSIQLLSREEVVAIVSAVDPTGLVVEIVRPPSPWPFQQKDRVIVKYWNEGAEAYFWKAEVKGTAPSHKKLQLSILGEGVTIQRRKSYRFNTPLPFSCTIVESLDGTLVGKKLVNCTTSNVSVNGFLFETATPFQLGDRLAVTFRLPPDEQLGAVAWVVRSTSLNDQKDLHAVAAMFLQLEERDQLHLLQSLAHIQEETDLDPI